MMEFSQACGHRKNQRSALKLGANVLKVHRDWQEVSIVGNLKMLYNFFKVEGVHQRSRRPSMSWN